MNGLFSGTVRFKPICVCSVCGTNKLSSTTNQIDIGVTDSLDSLYILIQNEIDRVLVQPPEGWSVNGRGNFKCEKCKT